MRLKFQVTNPPTVGYDLSSETIGNYLPPIILLHDVFGSKKSWRLVAPKLARDARRQVYCLDARNHGDSAWSPHFTVQLMVNDIKEFLIEQNISKVVLVGSGMGGYVAMKLALQSPELVEKVVSENMMPRPYYPFGWRFLVVTFLTLGRVLGHIPPRCSAVEAKTAVANYFNIHLPHMNPIRNRDVWLEVMPLKEDDGAFYWEANLGAITLSIYNDELDSGLVGTYHGDVMFLRGRESFLRNHGTEAMFPGMFPRYMNVPVFGAANMMPLEMPDAFVAYVGDFINLTESQELWQHRQQN